MTSPDIPPRNVFSNIYRNFHVQEAKCRSKPGKELSAGQNKWEKSIDGKWAE
jgi:hypothetical protein